MVNSNIFLVGPSGVGKTTIGKKLATICHLSFYEVDVIIEKRAGVNLEWIFDKEGEDGYQKRAEKVIVELSSMERVVVATNPIAINSAASCNNMLKRGIVIYLSSTIEGQLEKAIHNKQEDVTEEEKAALLKELQARARRYLEAADITIETNGKGVKLVVDEIVEKLKEF